MSFHAMPSGKAWGVRRSGAVRARKVGLTKSAAWREARRLARAAETIAYLHDRTGRIVTRNVYG